MPSKSIFKNTHTKSHLPSNDFIEAWQDRLKAKGYKNTDRNTYQKDRFEVTIVDHRKLGRNLAEQFVHVQYRIIYSNSKELVDKDIPLEEFEKINRKPQA